MRSCYYINFENIKVFGRWLAEQRKARLWTQCELAEKLDVSQITVSRWETGEAFPTQDNLLKIAELFGVTLDVIFKFLENTSYTQTEPERQRIAEHNAKPEPDRKTPEERVRELEAKLSISQTENTTLKETKHELEAELGFARAEILKLKKTNRQLKAVMQQFIG